MEETHPLDDPAKLARLLKSLEQAPYVPEENIPHFMRTGQSIRENKRRVKEGLTNAETRVVQCASYGMTTDMTADILGITRNTVLHHLKSARYRAKAKNTCHLVATAIRNGWIS